LPGSLELTTCASGWQQGCSGMTRARIAESFGSLSAPSVGIGLTSLSTAARRAPDAARAILTPGQYADIKVHNWQFGGRQ